MSRDREAPSTPPERLTDWQIGRYPDQATFDRIVLKHGDVAYDAETNSYKAFPSLPPWIRLEWPSEALWKRCKGLPHANKPWSVVSTLYESQADAERVLKYWPDCFGRPLVEVDIVLKEGITINEITYGPGKHLVPDLVAVDLRHIDNAARQEFLNQFIPKVHQERVLATLSMTGGGSTGEIRG